MELTSGQDDDKYKVYDISEEDDGGKGITYRISLDVKELTMEDAKPKYVLEVTNSKGTQVYNYRLEVGIVGIIT